MKIAIIGKGGSGKSTVSWLLVNYIAKQGKKVLAIDADYNMDLSSNLGVDPNDIINTIHSTEKYFIDLIGMQENISYKEYSISHENKPFTFTTNDDYTNFVSHPVSPNIKLILGGIGQENVYYSNKCGHAHLSSLKYYLSLLETNVDEYIVIDSVAGLDMVNFGLYAGCDMVICVVENNRNSINVLNQVKSTCAKIGTPVFVIVNKYKIAKQSPEMQSVLDNDTGKVLGYIPVNENLLDYNYTNSIENELGISEIITNIIKVYQKIDSWGNVRKIDKDKLSNMP
jgi:CO dehydrogenase maturation factor